MKTKIFFIIASLLLPFGMKLAASEPYSLSFYLEYRKLAEGERKISATAKYKPDRFWEVIQGMKVEFYYLNEEGDEVLLADGITDEKGTASILIDPEYPLYRNEEGLIEFVARTEETEKYELAEEWLSIRDIYLEMKLIEDGDERTIELHAEVLDENGELVPLSDEDIYFSVPRMFSKLPLGEETLEDGFCSITFPANIVGNAEREVTILAEIFEHYEFGTVQASKVSTWGKLGSPHLIEHPSRELWTPVAPLWMIITLIVLLVGVWGHYIYAIVQLVLIRKAGTRFEREQQV